MSVEHIKKQLATLQLDLQTWVMQIEGPAEKLLECARKVAESHTGSWFGWHSEMYFEEFEKAPRGSFSIEWGDYHGLTSGWKTRTFDEVKKFVEASAGITFDQLDNQSKPIIERAKELRRLIETEIGPEILVRGSEPAKAALDELAKVRLDREMHNKYCSLASQAAPKMTRDSGAASQGLKLPPHVWCEAAAVQLSNYRAELETLAQLTKKLLKFHTLEATTAAKPVAVENVLSTSQTENRWHELSLALNGLLLALIIVAGFEFFLAKGHMSWLASHPNSYAIRALGYLALLLIFEGAFLRRFRKNLWSAALLSTILALFPLLGGPKR